MESSSGVTAVAISNAISRFVDFQRQDTGINKWVQARGLLSYGPSYMGQGRHAATFVDKMLTGAVTTEPVAADVHTR